MIKPTWLCIILLIYFEFGLQKLCWEKFLLIRNTVVYSFLFLKCLSGFVTKLMLVSQNELENNPSCSVFKRTDVEFFADWHYFFFKCLVEFTSELIGAWSFLCGDVFIHFNFFKRYLGLFILLESAPVVCVFHEICSFQLSWCVCWYKDYS